MESTFGLDDLSIGKGLICVCVAKPNRGSRGHVPGEPVLLGGGGRDDLEAEYLGIAQSASMQRTSVLS